MAVSRPLRRLLQNAPMLMGVLLILLISLSFATQTIDWLQLNRSNTAVQSSETGEASGLAAAPALDSIQTLFAAPRVVQNTAPPATSLRLTLRGSFLHSDPRRSSAIIQRESSKPQRYAIGSEIDKGITLHAVYRDRVEIERNGRLESLMFAKRTASTGTYQPQDYGAVDDLSTLQQEDEQRLRERMDALRQQMESAGESSSEMAPDDVPEPLSQPVLPSTPPSIEPHPSDPPTDSE